MLIGEEVDGVLARRLGRRRVARWPSWTGAPRAPSERASVTRDDTAEIIFTSGATAEPKGVVITHRNVLANIVPVEREILKYREVRAAVLADPVPEPAAAQSTCSASRWPRSSRRCWPGRCVFIHGYNPHDIVRQIKARRISVLVSVPKILDVLREHVLRVAPERRRDAARRTSTSCGGGGDTARVHRAFGWKFWSFVVGAAPLDPALEEFWGRLGFAVIQGYGLTETAPIVSLNHPFSTSKGSVGKAIAGVEVRIARRRRDPRARRQRHDGLLQSPTRRRAEAFEDGWFHTGDIGELDAQGRLFIKGRKKEMIVTPEGLNVFPEDVERVVAGRRRRA